MRKSKFSELQILAVLDFNFPRYSTGADVIEAFITKCRLNRHFVMYPSLKSVGYFAWG
jgi:hypothetical protein